MAARAGLAPDVFWRLTPWQTEEYIAGQLERLTDERKADLWHAWHVAALGRARKMPKLETFVGLKKPAPDRSTLAAELKATLRGFKGRKARG